MLKPFWGEKFGYGVRKRAEKESKKEGFIYLFDLVALTYIVMIYADTSERKIAINFGLFFPSKSNIIRSNNAEIYFFRL